MENNNKLAVLIDAENVSAQYAQKIFDTASSKGEVVIKKIFADWNAQSNKNWKQEIANFGIMAEQQFCFVKGKNTSDMSLTIQAMEILFERPHINAFVIVSSDSDYIRLVLELKERDKQVIGLGMRSAIEAYKNSYTEFIYLDEEAESSRPQTTTRPQHKKVKAPEAVVVDPKPVVKTDEKQTSFEEIVDLLIDEKGKAYYSQIGIDMKNKYPDFVPQNYGVNSPKKLIKLFADKVGKYEVKTGEDKTSLYLVRKSI